MPPAPLRVSAPFSLTVCPEPARCHRRPRRRPRRRPGGSLWKLPRMPRAVVVGDTATTVAKKVFLNVFFV